MHTYTLYITCDRRIVVHFLTSMQKRQIWYPRDLRDIIKIVPLSREICNHAPHIYASRRHLCCWLQTNELCGADEDIVWACGGSCAGCGGDEGDDSEGMILPFIFVFLSYRSPLLKPYTHLSPTLPIAVPNIPPGPLSHLLRRRSRQAIQSRW